MTRRLASLGTALALLGALLAMAPVATVSAAVTCTSQIIVYSGSNGSGYARALCAEDYPLSRSPATGGSFDGGWSWPGCSSACTMDDSISSYSWMNTAQPGVRMKFYESYYFNAGETLIVTRPSVGNGPFNIPSANNNQISSFAGCGTSCSDFPG